MSGGGRRRKRKNKTRQHGQTLEQRAQSAQAAGVSRGPAVSPHAKSCPAQIELARLKAAQHVKQAPARYEPCEIKSLTIQMSIVEKLVPTTKTIVIPGPRRTEAPSPNEKSYFHQLSEYDLILEALSNAENVTTKGGHREATEEKEPLKIKAKAVDQCSHRSFTPAHPMTTIVGGGDDFQPIIKYAGEEAEAELPLDRTRLLAPSTWGRIWPFGTNDPRNWVVYAASCGNPPPPQQSVGWLSALVPVFPYEEWTITMGLGKLAGKSIEAEHNFHGEEKDAIAVTHKSEHGTETEQTEVKFREKGMSVERTSAKADAMKLSTFSVSQKTEVEWENGGRKVKGSVEPVELHHEAQKITVQWKVGGQEAEFKAGEFINQLLKFADIVKDITKLFGTVKIGWSVGANVSLLEGQLRIAFGHRWPQAYVERSRVYHVERFFGIGGNLKLIAFGVEAMAGLDVQMWTGDSVVGKIFAKIEGDVSVSADVQRTWTSATAPMFDDKDGGKDVLVKCKPQISLEGSLGIQGGGFVLGYGVMATAAVTAKFEMSADMAFSWQHGPAGKLSGTLEPIEAKIEVKRASSGTAIWTSNPWTIIEKHEIWKDKPFFGG